MTNKRMILEHIRIAGYENDLKAALRLYTEHRISYADYQKAWNQGQAQAAMEYLRGCPECET